MKPPRSGRASPSGQMRRRVRPWPSSGAATPHAMQLWRIIAAAALSAIANGTFCSAATRWYARMRAIMGRTRVFWPPPPPPFFFSSSLRHLLQHSGSSAAAEGWVTSADCAATADGCSFRSLVEKKPVSVGCKVVSLVRRQAKQRTSTASPSSRCWRKRFFPDVAVFLPGIFLTTEPRQRNAVVYCRRGARLRPSGLWWTQGGPGLGPGRDQGGACFPPGEKPRRGQSPRSARARTPSLPESEFSHVCKRRRSMPESNQLVAGCQRHTTTVTPSSAPSHRARRAASTRAAAS
jgi:hypothetical protein